MSPDCANQLPPALRPAGSSPRLLWSGLISLVSMFVLAVSASSVPRLIDAAAQRAGVHVAAVDRAEMLRQLGVPAGADITGLACWREACLVIALTAIGRGHGGAA